jgi:hypothetical protein
MRVLLQGVLLGCLAAASCRCNDAPRPAPALAPLLPSVAQAPAKPASVALANRVCGLLQREPARRRAQCCSGGEARHLGVECEQALGAALERGALVIDDAAVEACAAASAREVLGCDWVTPSQPLPPPACRSLSEGRVAEGGSCRSSLECVAPLHCGGSTPSQAGHCAVPQPNGSACGSTPDALATYLLAGDAERSHPSCAGRCSLVSRRCEEATPAGDRPAAGESGQALAGAACQSDFDCRAGGCSGGHCGMKCAVAFGASRGQASSSPLAFRRRADR